MLLSVPVRTLTDWAAAVYESADSSVHARKEMDAVFNVPVDIGATEYSQAQIDAGGVRGNSGLLMFCVLQSGVGRFKGTPQHHCQAKAWCGEAWHNISVTRWTPAAWHNHHKVITCPELAFALLSTYI